MKIIFYITMLVVMNCGGTSSNATLNGCDDAAYEDRTASGADREVAFGGEHGSPTFGFSPRCVIVAVGQTVNFTGAFSGHPLSPGLAGESGGPANNPIPKMGSGTATPVTFATAGTYPYFCEAHFGGGMKGAVRVK